MVGRSLNAIPVSQLFVLAHTGYCKAYIQASFGVHVDIVVIMHDGNLH